MTTAAPRNPDLAHAIGRRVRLARRANGLSQAGLAAAVGLSRVSITQIEGGKSNATTSTLENIARVLGMPDLASLMTDAPVLDGRLRVSVSPAMLNIIRALHATGMWGATVEDAASELLRIAVRSHVAAARAEIRSKP